MEVQDGEIRPFGTDHLHGGLPVGALPYDLQFGSGGTQGRNAFPDDGVIIRDNDGEPPGFAHVIRFGHPCRQACSARPALDEEVPASPAQLLAHGPQADSGRRSTAAVQDGGGIETRAVVLYDQLQVARGARSQPEADAGSARVPHHVGQGLLRHTIQQHPDVTGRLRGERDQLQDGVELTRDAGGVPQACQRLGEGGPLPVRGVDAAGDGAELLQRLLGQQADAVQAGADLLGRIRLSRVDQFKVDLNTCQGLPGGSV